MRLQLSRDWLKGALMALAGLLLASPALAEKGKLLQRLTPEVMATVYPAGADRLGPEEGSPPATVTGKSGEMARPVLSWHTGCTI